MYINIYNKEEFIISQQFISFNLIFDNFHFYNLDAVTVEIFFNVFSSARRTLRFFFIHVYTLSAANLYF